MRVISVGVMEVMCVDGGWGGGHVCGWGVGRVWMS